MNHSPPGSSVHGILQARILEWVAIPFSRGSSWPRDQTKVFCIAGRVFTVWATGKVDWPGLLPGSSPNHMMAEGGILGDSNMQQGWEPLQQKLRPGCPVRAQKQLCSHPKGSVAHLNLIYGVFICWPECAEFCHHQEHRFYLWVGGSLILLKTQK